MGSHAASVTTQKRIRMRIGLGTTGHLPELSSRRLAPRQARITRRSRTFEARYSWRKALWAVLKPRHPKGLNNRGFPTREKRRDRQAPLLIRCCNHFS
ncbi:hypothetical protein VUR80DRAFT_8416 [Thermomyces stellatus]